MTKYPGEIALTFHRAGKVQMNKFLFDIWILEFDISCWHLDFGIWNCYLSGSKEFGRSGVGKDPKVPKLLTFIA